MTHLPPLINATKRWEFHHRTDVAMWRKLWKRAGRYLRQTTRVDRDNAAAKCCISILHNLKIVLHAHRNPFISPSYDKTLCLHIYSRATENLETPDCKVLFVARSTGIEVSRGRGANSVSFFLVDGRFHTCKRKRSARRTGLPHEIRSDST